MKDIESLLTNNELNKSEKKEFPDWVKPMLAKLTHDYFNDENWIYERKLDGERIIAYINNSEAVKLMTRNKKNANENYPEIVSALSKNTEKGSIVDGEIIAFNKDNVSDFQKLQPRMQAGSRTDAEKSDVKVYYYIFDCLYANGRDITGCSLKARKSILKEIVDWNDPLRWTPHRNEEGIDYYKEACEKGWEGVIAKDITAGYASSRSKKWLKFKCNARQEFVIGGFTDPEGERVGFGALLLGYYDNGKLIYAGKVGTGFDEEELKKLKKQLDSIEKSQSPYNEGGPNSKDAHFVKPEMVCEVAFTEWTTDNNLRHPRYKGLRRDKRPDDVHREESSQAADL